MTQHCDQQVAVGDRRRGSGPAPARRPAARGLVAGRRPRDDLGEHRVVVGARRPLRRRRRRPAAGRSRSAGELARRRRGPRTGAACRSAAASPAPGPRRRAGPRSRARWSPAAAAASAAPSATAAAARPGRARCVHSVTGCSTWSRVFISRKKKRPARRRRGTRPCRRRRSRSRAAAATRRLVQPLAHARRPLDQRRRRLLDDLLVPALDRAVPLAERPHRAVLVGHDLHLDVPAALDVRLAEDGRRRRTPTAASARAPSSLAAQVGERCGRRACRGRRRRRTP